VQLGGVVNKLKKKSYPYQINKKFYWYPGLNVNNQTTLDKNLAFFLVTNNHGIYPILDKIKVLSRM
jgi:hypothetical protein